MTTTTLVSAEQLLWLPHDGFRYELVGGELKRMTPAGWRHGVVGSRLHLWLAHHVEQHGLGLVFNAETGFVLARDPDTVLAPDAAFIRKERLSTSLPKEGFWPGAPDLAVEVVSATDRPGEVDEKAKAWLDAGAAMVWVVHPLRRTVSVYRAGAEVSTLTERDELDGQDVVAGFRCRVGDLFVST